MAPRAGTDAIRFPAQVVSLNGRRILRLPADASAALPSRGQVAVSGTIGDEPFETVVEPDGRRGHWIRLDDIELSNAPGDGEVVPVSIVPRQQWPEPDVPADLQAALDEAPDLADLWASITPMARWEWVRWVQATRNPATRARRVEVSISKMRHGKRRPCCFDLSSCTDPDLARSGKLMQDPGAD